MFSIRSKLVSLLQPWLQSEPDLEIKLGFLRSHGNVKNLCFDISALNRLLDDTACFCFKEVRVQNVNFQFSSWSFPAFTLELSGLYVKLVARKPVGDGYKSKTNWSLKEKKAILSVLDPEGTLLHDAIERISVITSARNSLMSSLLNVILKHCRLSMHDVNLELQLSVTDDTVASFLKIKKLSVEALQLQHTCLLKGLIGAILMPQKVCSLALNATLFDIGLKREEHANRIFSIDDLSTSIKLKDLRLLDLIICVPQFHIAFSPIDLPILQVSDILTYKEVTRARNGRELWNIAASRIHSLTSNPKLSLCKFVNAARQWLRYVHSYESLLSVIGYPAEIAFEKSSARMSLNKKFSISVKNQLKEISEYEEDLSVAVLARARQIARHRAAIHDQQIASSNQPNLEANKNFFLKILSFLTKTIRFIFQLVMHLFFVGSMLNRHSKVDGSSKVVLEDYNVHYCFNIRKVFITVYPISAGPSLIGRTSESPFRISHMNLLSFCVTLDVFSLIYTAGNVAQSLYLSCGDFKVNSTSIGPLKDKNVREEKGHSVKRKMKERRIDSEVIVWGEPAPKSPHTEQVVVDLVDTVGGASFLHMESYLEELWLNWKKFHNKFEGSNAQYIENPFLLCEIKSSLMDQSLDCPQIGLWKCNLSMGKLNIDLGHSSIISMALLLRQIQHVLHHNAGSGGATILSQSSGINEPEERKWQDLQTSYASETKMAILRATPEKKIQIGIAIAGPKIRMSLLGGLHNAMEQNVNNIVTGHSDVYIAFNLENIELCVWPTSKASLGASTQKSKVDDVGFENFRSDAPQLINTTEECLNEKFIYEGSIALDSWIRMSGLTVYLEDLGENQQYQVLGLDSLFIRSLSTRKSTISFPTTVIALSTSLRGMAAGAIVLSYMDEYEMFFQVFERILSALSYAFTNLELPSGVYLCETEEFCGIDPDVFTHLSEKGSFLILKCIQFVIDASFEFGSVDIIIHNSRKNHIVEYYKRTYGVSSKILPIGRDVPEHGIAVAVQKTHAQFLWEEGRVETCIGLSGLQLVIFSHQSQTGEHQNISELRNVLYQSPNCLYELCMSSCSLTLCTGSYNAINSHSSGRSNYNAIDDPPLALLSEGSGLQSCDSNRVRSLASDLQLSSCDNLILINIDLGEILMMEHSLRNILNRPHKETKLLSSLCIPMDDYTISWTIQGGLIILEMTALAMYIRCFSAYFLRIQNAASILPSKEFVSSGRKSEPVEPYKEMVRQSNHPSKEYHLNSTSSLPHSGTCDTPQSKWILSEGLRLTLTQFSLILVIANGSGGVSQFVLEADFLFYIEFSNLRRKMSFDLSRLMVVSQHLHETFQEHTDDVQVLRSSPVADSEFPLSTASGDVSFGFQCTKSVSPICCDASSSSPVPQNEFIVENDIIAGHSHFIHGNYILKHAAASVLVEKAASRPDVDQFQLNTDWIGSGSVSGLDMTISLTEIEMILFLVDSLADNLSGGDAGNSKQRHRSKNQGQNSVSEDKVLDGAIVAIQDLHQHTYFAVDGLENIYRVFGAIHYSLVGKKALFRVEHCSKKRWGSTASWFTLTSLHAKSDLEEPLRLNYRSGSGFVDISSNNDDCSLWRTLDYTHETYEADNDFESDSQSSKHTFYLVNKKCGRAVAFIDGVPEFVKKPGNPFKFKLFPDVSFTPHALTLDPPSERTHDPDVQDHQTHQDEGQTSAVASNLPYISITMDKVVLTIVHELPDSNDKFPLLQACIDNIQLIVQFLSSKARVISTCTATILYFDAQGNMWREIVRPVDLCMFYHCRFEVQSSEIVAKGVPVHFYFRIKQVDVSLTELSLDILLFVVGELKMAGPFAVRSSAIFSNCCKIENQSSLSLICCFYDKQEATVSAKRSALIFIRPVALASRPENSSYLSVQLAALGDFTTSPIHVSLSNARVLAWRTRVISLQDSRSFPGPFVVVDVSKTTKDGLSVVVSPLLRVHNETGFSIEILFWRPKQKQAESASVMLRNGDTIDDSMAALDAINLHGGSKKALMSLILGNFLFSCRPVITEQSGDLGESISAEWSEDLKGGKVVCLSGIFDKLNYRFRQALGVKSGKISFSTVRCALSVEGAHITDLHFLIQTIGKDVPVVQPEELRDTTETRTVPVALQEQKEIFLLPTVQVTNYLKSEIHVLLTETQPDLSSTGGCSNIGKQATILCGSSANLYVNPAMIYFTVTLTEFNSSCKAVNSGDWVKKLQKKKSELNYLDIDLDFGGGKCFASLRLSRSDRGVLEAAIFTSYVLQNDCELSLLCFASGQKPLSRLEIDKFGSSLPPDLGLFLPPKTTRSWFLKSNRMNLKLLDDKTSMALLDMDVLSGFTEVCLETHVGENVTHISKLGVSLKPWNTNMSVPSQIVSIVPRYAVLNETDQTIFIRQCCLEEDLDGTIAVDGKQKAALHMKTGRNRRRERKLLDSLFRKHKNASEDYLIYIQFCLNDTGSSWSGPICIASLGRFFLKFRRHIDSLGSQSSPTTGQESKLMEFAVVHVVEEGPALVLHFDRPLNFTPPYRIENLLGNASITYYQKDSMDQDILGPGSSFGYVWDDLNLPHQLVVQITDMNLSREISLDKVRPWKPFFKVRQQRGLALNLPLEKKSRNQIKDKDESFNLEMLKVGYEVYADGATRVLRICEFPGRGKEDSELHLCAKYQFRVSNLAIHILENKKQEENVSEPSVYSPIVVARLGNINLDSMITDQNKYNQIRVQSINVDEKWDGAPFAAILRRNESDYSDTNENILQIVFVLLSTDSGVQKVKYASIVLQPLQLNLDEETLMRFVPFWRTSLSTSSTSQQYYFEHFEIHPIKVVASFLPGSSDGNYSSSQETLRSFLHSVIKIPAVKDKNVELNGILLTHAMVTVRELCLKCAQHYSWYAMRAVYIAKGSPLLPPAFASIFDDSASSSLDIFFDPSSGIVNVPGITIGMFKFISKCIDKKGFSGTKRYFGDLGKTIKTAGSNVLFAAVTEISDCVLKGAEANGFNGMVNGFHQGILRLAMEPSVLGTAVMEGGPDRKIKLDRSPGVDELYIEGYLQAMLDTIYKQEYLRVRVIDNQVILKNLPPNSSLLNEIMERVRSFLISKALLQGDPSTACRPLRHLRGETEWKIGPTILTLWEHLFVSFAIRMLRKRAVVYMANTNWKKISGGDSGKTIVPTSSGEKQGIKLNLKWGVRKFVFSGIVAYLDGRLCRCIPNAIVRRIVSGFLLSLLDDNNRD